MKTKESKGRRCDVCGGPVGEQLVDGRPSTVRGRRCASPATRALGVGLGFGLGRGQLYQLAPDGTWVKVRRT